MPIPDYEGAYAAEAAFTPFAGQGNRIKVRLIMRRVPLYMGPLLDGQPRHRYHYFVTGRVGDLLYLEKDHRRHAEVEGAIRDLKYEVGLNHFPSGNFGANAAWLWIQALAHNVCRWLRQIGDPRQGVLTAATLRRRIIAVPGPITRSGRRSMLHLRRSWPWAEMFNRILGGLQAMPEPD